MRLFKKNKKDYGVYRDTIGQFKPTIKSLVFNILYAKFLELKRTKESFYVEDASFRLPQESMPHGNLKYLAIVQNGLVKEMIRIDSGTAEILTKRGSKLIEFDPKETKVIKGTKFNGTDFINDEN
jgi:hypothetical protein